MRVFSESEMMEMNRFLELIDPNKWNEMYQGRSVPLDWVIRSNIRTELEEAFGELVAFMYFSDTQEPPVYFKRGFVHLDLWGVSYQKWASLREPEMISQFCSRIQDCAESENYNLLFNLIPARFRMGAFLENINTIPQSFRYDCFREAYVKSEYAMKQVDRKTALSLFSIRHHSEVCTQSLVKLRKLVDGTGILTIYRGEGSGSTPIDQALSWTLQESTAHFFSTRFNQSGIVYKAYVQIEDVMDYITDRNEEEVLILPEHVQNLTKSTIQKNKKTSAH